MPNLNKVKTKYVEWKNKNSVSGCWGSFKNRLASLSCRSADSVNIIEPMDIRKLEQRVDIRIGKMKQDIREEIIEEMNMKYKIEILEAVNKLRAEIKQNDNNELVRQLSEKTNMYEQKIEELNNEVENVKKDVEDKAFVEISAN
jgi:hypothetical protein